MATLHNHGKWLHRDLKATNVLWASIFKIILKIEYKVFVIADFETAEGVVGTRFWRVLEILYTLKNKAKNMLLDPKIWMSMVMPSLP